jgi:hypothetical protein
MDGSMIVRLASQPRQSHSDLRPADVHLECEISVRKEDFRNLPVARPAGGPETLVYAYQHSDPIVPVLPGEIQAPTQLEVWFTPSGGECWHSSVEWFVFDSDGGMAGLSRGDLFFQSRAASMPLRVYPYCVEDTIGWSDQKVLAELGKPDYRSRMVMPGIGDPSWYGPSPKQLRPGTDFENWSYQNVMGSNWVLYLVWAIDAERCLTTEPVPEAVHTTRPSLWRCFFGKPEIKVHNGIYRSVVGVQGPLRRPLWTNPLVVVEVAQESPDITY